MAEVAEGSLSMGDPISRQISWYLDVVGHDFFLRELGQTGPHSLLLDPLGSSNRLPRDIAVETC